MTPRMKWLLAACAGVFGLYMIDALYRNWIEQPQTELNRRIETLSNDLTESKQQQLQSQKTGRRLAEYSARALPSDPMLARSSYQEWLLELVDQHKFAATSVDASQPVPLEIKSRTKKGKRIRIGHRIDYSLRGQASLAKLAEFLDQFRKAGHLHKIRSLTLNPIGSEGRLDVNLSIQVLSMESSMNESDVGDWTMLSEAQESLKPAAALVRRNPFARGFAKALNDVQLRAITTNREGIIEAWFAADARGSIKKVPAGSNIPLALHEITVVEILRDRVLVNVNQEPQWIQMGESIGDAMTRSMKVVSGDEE
ncbi:MAG: hypothetical protein ACK57G_05045 [Planctomycetota bacterium]